MIQETVYSINPDDSFIFDFLEYLTHDNKEKIYSILHQDINYLKEMLQKKGVEYSSLKSVLTPPSEKNKKELILCFEAEKFGGCYGSAIFDLIFPLINKKRNHIVKAGDIEYDQYYNDRLSILKKHLKYIGTKRINNNCNYFIIYINNTIKEEVDTFINELKNVNGFIGYYENIFNNTLCDMISNTLVQMCIQVKSLVIILHTAIENKDDDNVNVTSIDFMKYKFKYISINEYYYHMYLTYRIKTSFYNEKSIENTLNYLDKTPCYLDERDLYISEDKYNYIIKHDEGAIVSSGLAKLSYEEFKTQIIRNFKLTNLFNLEYKEEEGVFSVNKFNTIFEYRNPETLEKYRFIIALKYDIDRKRLEVITMF